MFVNFRLKATQIIGQRKAFYRQRIPESSFVRKETTDMDILAASRNGDRKIMQSIRITSRSPSRKRKQNHLSQFWRTSTKVIPIERLKSFCPLIFRKFLFFTKWQPFKNYEGCFSFHLKSSFHYWDIQIFVFSPSPLFLPVDHCLRAWSKINLEVYDAINCLNRNLITHFAWYLEKERRYDIETLAIVQY